MTILTYNDVIATEQNLLAILSMNSEKVKNTEIKPELFSNIVHQTIYRAMKDSLVNDRIEMLELMKHLSSSELDYYIKLQDMYVSSANFEYVLEKVQEQYKVRMAASYLKELNNHEISFDEYIIKLNELNSSYSSTKLEKKNPSKADIEEKKKQLMSKKELLRFTKFDELTTKVRMIKNSVNIIAARPSVGKTSLALNLMDDLSNYYKCIYLNLENSQAMMEQRVVGIEANLPINDFEKATYDPKIDEKLTYGVEQLLKKDFFMIHESQTVGSIRTLVSKYSRKEHIIVFVDHVGYVVGNPKETDHDRITRCMKEFNQLTKDYDCTFIVLAHINRTGSDDPKLEHLKDSGELEQTAHTALILNYDMGSTDTELFPTMKLFVGKNRSGARGNIYFRYDKRTQIFYEGKRNSK